MWSKEIPHFDEFEIFKWINQRPIMISELQDPRIVTKDITLWRRSALEQVLRGNSEEGIEQFRQIKGFIGIAEASEYIQQTIRLALSVGEKVTIDQRANDKVIQVLKVGEAYCATTFFTGTSLRGSSKQEYVSKGAINVNFSGNPIELNCAISQNPQDDLFHSDIIMDVDSRKRQFFPNPFSIYVGERLLSSRVDARDF